MLRWRDPADVPPGFGPSTVTMGNFDGVHRGHSQVLRRLVADARASGSTAVVVTFDPHPARVHRPDDDHQELTSIDQRLDLIESLGVDAVLVIPYSLEFARQSPEEFVGGYLVGLLGMTRIVVGTDVRFGWGNSGDLGTMRELGGRYGFDVDVVADFGASDNGTGVQAPRWSSTAIRALIGSGDVVAAGELLGRHPAVTATVVHGDKRGRELGFPTANLGGDLAGMVPADGVYAGTLTVGDVSYPAAISVGTNPTFGAMARRVEAYVLDRTDLDLYGVAVTVTFIDRVRQQIAFDGIPALISQMHADVAAVRDILRHSRW